MPVRTDERRGHCLPLCRTCGPRLVPTLEGRDQLRHSRSALGDACPVLTTRAPGAPVEQRADSMRRSHVFRGA
jgi:hypothetical protein